MVQNKGTEMTVYYKKRCTNDTCGMTSFSGEDVCEYCGSPMEDGRVKK